MCWTWRVCDSRQLIFHIQIPFSHPFAIFPCPTYQTIYSFFVYDQNPFNQSHAINEITFDIASINCYSTKYTKEMYSDGVMSIHHYQNAHHRVCVCRLKKAKNVHPSTTHPRSTYSPPSPNLQSDSLKAISYFYDKKWTKQKIDKIQKFRESVSTTTSHAFNSIVPIINTENAS